MTMLNKMIGNETFLQGKYLSVGVSSSGSIGTKQAAPTGQTTDVAAGYQRVGLVADMDGFGTGAAAMHEAVLRGVGVEGFSVGYKTKGATYVHSNQERTGLQEIAGKASNESTKTVGEAAWTGTTTEKLGVDQKIILTEDAKYLRIEVTLTNNSAATMTDLRYLRTVDPDLADGFKTINTIVKQGSGSALVTAAASAKDNPMFLYANDARAIVTTGGFINEDPYAALVATAQKIGTTTKTDTSMSINFTLDPLAAGASTTVVFYMGVTDNLTTTIAEIDTLDTGTTPTTPPVPVNVAPDANNDTLSIAAGDTGKGNVLANDTDGNGDALTAKLKAGPAHGTVTIAADGSYVYKAAAGYVGADSFTYTASDGTASASATVAVTVKAPPLVNTGLPDSALVQRAGTVDGSASTASTLSGAAGHNSFYFDLAATSGIDKIANFERDDIMVTKGLLNDGNGDGIIALSKSTVGLQGTDKLVISGVSTLRFLGTDETGLSVYANGAVKPKSAIEGKIGGDTLVGDVSDAKKNVFFFDTGLDIQLGNDRIDNFGAKDILVTTSALSNTALGSTGMVKLVGDAGALGTIDLNGTTGAAVQALEFDGSLARGGVTYYVYSHAGSAVGLADLGF